LSSLEFLNFQVSKGKGRDEENYQGPSMKILNSESRKRDREKEKEKEKEKGKGKGKRKRKHSDEDSDEDSEEDSEVFSEADLSEYERNQKRRRVQETTKNKPAKRSQRINLKELKSRSTINLDTPSMAVSKGKKAPAKAVLKK